MNEGKKLKLIEALKAEKEWMPEYSVFGEKNNLGDYDEAINYLRTGINTDKKGNNELLTDIINDFDGVCKLYDIL